MFRMDQESMKKFCTFPKATFCVVALNVADCIIYKYTKLLQVYERKPFDVLLLEEKQVFF